MLTGMEAPPNFGAAYTSEFRGVYRDLAREHDVTFMPFYLEGVAGIPSLNIADGMHPNPEGSRIVEKTIWSRPRAAAREADRRGKEPWAMIELAERLQDRPERRSSADDSASARLHDSVRAVRRDRRAVGQRQVHAARSARRARCADDRADPHRRRGHHDADEDGLARLRGEKIGFVFQFFHLVPSLTAFENVLVPMEIAGRRDAVRARAGSCSTRLG